MKLSPEFHKEHAEWLLWRLINGMPALINDLEHVISMIPSGEQRNRVTEANILVGVALKKLKEAKEMK